MIAKLPIAGEVSIAFVGLSCQDYWIDGLICLQKGTSNEGWNPTCQDKFLPVAFAVLILRLPLNTSFLVDKSSFSIENQVHDRKSGLTSRMTGNPPSQQKSRSLDATGQVNLGLGISLTPYLVMHFSLGERGQDQMCDAFKNIFFRCLL
ncbi:MAG: hypothetical protein AAF399_06885 [Bacteroidota bacterium]